MKHTGWQTPWVRTVTTILTLAVMIMIFCFSTENAENSDKRSGVISLRIIRLFHPDYDGMAEGEQQDIYDSVQHTVRKCAHFTEYMLLGFFLRLCLESWFGHRNGKHRILFLTGFGAGAAYACSDELHQLLIDGRSGQWTDILVDSCGVLAGVAFGMLLIKSLNRMTQSHSDGKHHGSDENAILQEQ